MHKKLTLAHLIVLLLFVQISLGVLVKTTGSIYTFYHIILAVVLVALGVRHLVQALTRRQGRLVSSIGLLSMGSAFMNGAAFIAEPSSTVYPVAMAISGIIAIAVYTYAAIATTKIGPRK